MTDFDPIATEFDITSLYIGDKGATELAEKLKLSSTLTKLDLCDNNIRNDGIKEDNVSSNVKYNIKRSQSGS